MALVWGYTFDFTGLAALRLGYESGAGTLLRNAGWTTVHWNAYTSVVARARQPSVGYGGVRDAGSSVLFRR